jgi:hydroxyacyl-ACP dehydratase HTD2-like protein with hotdog domain
MAPPSLLVTVMMSGAPTRPEVPTMSRILDGGGEWEYYLPIKPGDVITCVTELADVTEREGKSGKMVFLKFETAHTNQKGELVGKSISTIITS